MSAERHRPSDPGPDRSTPAPASRGPGHSRRNRPPREPAAGRGGQVADGKDRRKVNLRDGEPADAELVSGVLQLLQDLAEHEPGYFRLLLDLARGSKPPSPRGVPAELRRAGLVARDGSVRPVFRDVLLSACRE